MIVSRNLPFVEGRRKLARRVSILSLALLAVIFASWFFMQQYPQYSIFLPLIFFGVFVATNLSKQLQFQWGPGTLADERLTQALKPLNNRYWFGAYVPVGREVVEEMLVGPEGVLVFVTRNHPGVTACERGRWRRRARLLSRFFGAVPALGNPTQELRVAMAALDADLQASGLGEVPVTGAVVFTAPDAVLELNDCGTTALTLQQLQGWAAGRRNSPEEIIPDELREQVIARYSGLVPEAPQPAAAGSRSSARR